MTAPLTGALVGLEEVVSRVESGEEVRRDVPWRRVTGVPIQMLGLGLRSEAKSCVFLSRHFPQVHELHSEQQRAHEFFRLVELAHTD